MKNDVFSSWFKELCSLIFVQTFQAFLIAIIMSVIVRILASTNAASLDGGIDAAGLLAVFALASLSKIELLIKNIFGLTSEHGDPSLAGGKTSLACTWLALKGVGRVLNNGGKIITGTGKAIGGQLRLRKALNDKGDNEIANRVSGDQALLNGASGGNSISREGTGIPAPSVYKGTGAITNLANEINALTKAVNEQNMNKKSKDDKDRTKALDDAIANAKKERNEGLKNIVSGTFETVGAAHGAIAGAVYGLSRGDDIAATTAAAAGAGDIIGEKVAAAINNSPSAVKNTKIGIKAEIRAHAPNSPARVAYKKLEKELSEENKKEFDKLNEKLDLYTKQQKSSNRNKGTIDDV